MGRTVLLFGALLGASLCVGISDTVSAQSNSAARKPTQVASCSGNESAAPLACSCVRAGVHFTTYAQCQNHTSVVNGKTVCQKTCQDCANICAFAQQ